MSLDAAPDSSTTTLRPFEDTWKKASDDEKAGLFDAAVADGSWRELLAFLAEEYPDQDACYRLAHILCAAQTCAAREPVSPKVLASYYHTLSGGGIETSVAALVLALSSKAKAIAFVDETSGVPADAAPELADSIFALELGKQANRPHYEVLADALDQHQADVLIHHAWFDPLLLWDVLACKAQGAAVVLNVHGVFSHFLDVTDGTFAAWNDGRMFALVPAIARLCDAVVCQNEPTQAFFGAFNPRSCLVRHTLSAAYLEGLAGVDPGQFAAAQPAADQPDEALQPRAARHEAQTLLWVGRFDIFKHPEDVIRILAQVKQDLPGARLVMCGESGYETYEHELLQLAGELGLADSVELVGFVDPLPYYDDATLLLSTTEVEGFCMVLAEACARALPIVAYDLPYLPFARCGGITWVAQGDIDAAARQAAVLLADEALWREQSQACRSFAQAEFGPGVKSGWDDVIQRLEAPCPPAAEHDSVDQRIWQTLFEHFMQGQRRTRVAHQALQEALQNERSRAEAAEACVVASEQSLDACRQEYEKSASYRVGRAVLALPRAARTALQSRIRR